MRNHVKKEAPEEEAGCALIVPAFDGLNLQKFCGPSLETIMAQNGGLWMPSINSNNASYLKCAAGV